MHLDWHEKAWYDYLYWQAQDRKTVRKINALLKTIEREGRAGKAEFLKGDLAGWASARIDQTNRLIYAVKGDTLKIMSCRGHYDE
jgi:toxin YoeB